MALIMWLKSSGHQIISGCGQYRVSQIRIDKWLIYRAEKHLTDHVWICLKPCETPGEAKVTCQEYMEQELCQK